MDLQVVVIIKIAVTVLFWAGPLLLARASLLAKLGLPNQPQIMVFCRLLGAAYTALVVAYIAGLLTIRAGGPGLSTVIMGMVSNGLACVVLAYYGFKGAWSAWGMWARLYMWLSMLVTAAITVALFLFGLL